MLAYVFLVLAFAVRFLVAIPAVNQLMNFNPLGAALLFFGATRAKREWAPAVALAVAIDIILTTKIYGLAPGWDVLAPLAYYIIALFIGAMLQARIEEFGDVVKVAGASVAGSVVFFVTSNFVSWLALDMYAKDFRGLVEAYVLAIPFFRNTLVGDLIFSLAMFATPLAVETARRNRAALVDHH